MLVEKTEKQLKDVVVESKYFCDRCGKEFYPHKIYGEFIESHFEIKEGFTYPENTSYTRTYAELCPDCAKLVFEKMKELGVKFQEKQEDY